MYGLVVASTHNAPTNVPNAPRIQSETVLNAPTPSVSHRTAMNQVTPPTTTVVPPSLDSGRIFEHALDPIVPQSATLGQYYPSFLRRQASTGRRQVVEDEADRELVLDWGGKRFSRGKRHVYFDRGEERTGRRIGRRAE